MTLFGEHGAAAVAAIFFCASLPFTLLLWFGHRLHPDTRILAITFGVMLYSGCCIFYAIYNVQIRNWVVALCWVINLVFNLWYLYHTWKRRKGKRKAAAALGAKSRALRDKLIRNLRDKLIRNLRESQPEGAR